MAALDVKVANDRKCCWTPAQGVKRQTAIELAARVGHCLQGMRPDLATAVDHNDILITGVCMCSHLN